MRCRMQHNQHFIKKQKISRTRIREIVTSQRLFRFKAWVSYKHHKNACFVTPLWLNNCEKEINAIIDSCILASFLNKAAYRNRKKG